MPTTRYRCVFHTDDAHADAVTAARDQLRVWLRNKKNTPALDIGAFDRGEPQLAPGVVLVSTEENDAKGNRTRQWRLRERQTGGQWLSTLVVHSAALNGGPRAWFWLDVDFVPDDPTRADNPPRAAVPGLARLLLEAVDAKDGWADLAERPRLVTSHTVEDLMDVLCDPNRRLPAVVASPHTRIDFQSWRGKVEEVTRFLPGLASLYILDPTAEVDFNDNVGAGHRVYGGAIRTYLPDLDFALADDAPRHRILSAARIVENPARARALLTSRPRELAANGAVPAPLARVRRTAKEVPDAGATLMGEVQRLREEVAVYEELLSEAADQISDYVHANEAANSDLEQANRTIIELGDRVRFLRRELVRVGAAGRAYAEPDRPTVLPEDLQEVIDRVSELPNVEFIGDPDTVYEQDLKARGSSWAQTAWMALLAMQNYSEAVAAGDFKGDFRRWCVSTPDGGRPFPPGKVGSGESDSVGNSSRMRGERVFTVPETVDPSGEVYMPAHIRLGGGAGMKEPRMHFHDATNTDGKVYVGYIGPHLRIKSTN